MGREGSMLVGIKYDKETGEGHYNGPKTIQNKLTTAFVEMILTQLYMGINFEKASQFARFIATNYKHVGSYNDRYRANDY